MRLAHRIGTSFELDSQPEIHLRCVETHCDICFPEQVTDGQQKLIFRSCTEYTYLWFDLYTAALYTGESCTELSSPDCAKQLALRYRRSFSVSDFVDGANAILERQRSATTEDLQIKVTSFHKLYEPVQETDRYEMRYIPSVGTTLLLNNKALGTVAGSDFANAYFGIWLGDNSLNDEAKKQLLKP